MYRIVTALAASAFFIQPVLANDDLLGQLPKLKSCQAIAQYVGAQIELDDVRIKSETVGGIEDLVMAGIGYVKAKNPKDVPAMWEKGVNKFLYQGRMRIMSGMIEQLISNYQRKVAQASWEDFVKDKTPDQIEQLFIVKYGAQALADVDQDIKSPEDVLIEFHTQAGDALYNKTARENSDEKLKEFALKYLRHEARKQHFETLYIEEKELEMVPSLREDNFVAIFIKAMDTAGKEQKDLQTVLRTYPAYVKLLDSYPADQLSKLFEPWREIDIQFSDISRLLAMQDYHKIPLTFVAPEQFAQLKPLWTGAEQESSFDVKATLNCRELSELEKTHGDQFAKFSRGELELLMSQGSHSGLGNSAHSTFYFKVDEMKPRQ